MTIPSKIIDKQHITDYSHAYIIKRHFFIMNSLNTIKTNEEDKRLLIRLKDSIQTIDPYAEIILYGSRARGDARLDSDYDLLILSDTGDSPKIEDSFRELIYPIELETGLVITVFLIAKDKWNTSLYQAMPFCQNVRRDGIVL